MTKFIVYAHYKDDPESDFIYVCSCNSKDVAENIANSLKFSDSGGRKDGSGLYNYYVREEK